MWLRIVLLLLIVSAQSALSQPADEVLDGVRSLYKSLGMTDRVQWLDAERENGRIRFGPLEGDVSAVCDMETGIITINTARTFQSYYSYVDLGQTLCHEAVHQTQDYETWKNQSWRQVVGLGNACEKEAWEEGFRSVRRMAIALQKRARTGASSRERAEAAAKLKHVVEAWQTLTNDWQEARKLYGDITVHDEKGVLLDWDEMATERTAMLKLVKDVSVTSAAMTRPFEGTYKGGLTSGSSGQIVFTIKPDHSLQGVVKGTYGKNDFSGRFQGTVNADGLLEARVNGKIDLVITDPPIQDFKGTLEAQISKDGSFTGSWDSDWPSGEFKGKRQ